MARKVFLPRELDVRLTELTGLTEEVNGILLYKRQGDACSVDALFMTAVGSVGHVQADSERMKVANGFFEANPGYQFIKFHTHSRGTISTCGEYYARHFSQGDISGIREQLSHDGDFMAMLVTPEVKLLSGIDNPELVVVDNCSDYYNRSQVVSQSLKDVAERLGCDMSRLRATR